MKKLNGFESYIVIEGLLKVKSDMINDIKELEAKGLNSMMTEGYVDRVVNEAIEKIKVLTIIDRYRFKLKK
jgi:hypothetical protein